MVLLTLISKCKLAPIPVSTKEQSMQILGKSK